MIQDIDGCLFTLNQTGTLTYKQASVPIKHYNGTIPVSLAGAELFKVANDMTVKVTHLFLNDLDEHT